jgi:hypothetical protein
VSVPAAPVPAGSKGWLLVRHGGALFGVDNEAVESLARGRGGFLLGLGDGELAVDEIIGVVAELAVHPVTAALRRFWPEAADGLAVHAAVPLVVVDPRRPPRAMRKAIQGDEDVQGDARDA